MAFYSRMKSAKDDGLIKVKTGRITSKALKGLVDDPKRAQFFFCGPKQFMLDVRQILQKEMGAPAENLHFEYYGPTPFMA